MKTDKNAYGACKVLFLQMFPCVPWLVRWRYRIELPWMWISFSSLFSSSPRFFIKRTSPSSSFCLSYSLFVLLIRRFKTSLTHLQIRHSRFHSLCFSRVFYLGTFLSLHFSYLFSSLSLLPFKIMSLNLTYMCCFCFFQFSMSLFCDLFITYFCSQSSRHVFA